MQLRKANITTKMELTEKALAEIKKSKRLRGRLALELDRTDFTIIRWVESKNDNLTKASALKIIREETGLSDRELIKNGSAAKV